MPLDPATLTAEQVADQLQSFDASQLASLIELANRQYWDEQSPVLPDPLYDQLVLRLQELAPEHALLQTMGPTTSASTGQDPDTLAQVEPALRFGSPVAHRNAMLSLDKCYDPQELYEWVEKKGCEVLSMPKMDGVAASLLYDTGGHLRVAATRGSGQVGEDITLRIQEIPDIPTTLTPAPGKPVEVRGEVYMRRSIFIAHYAQDFSHPRNLTAGSLKRKDASGGARGEHLSFYAYDLDGLALPHERDKLKTLDSFGFQSPDAEILELSAILESVQSHTAARDALDYEVDGIVYRIADVKTYQELGATGHHPRGAIAYKFQGQCAQSALTEIEWSVSRTGAITPVAIFEPVLVDGAQLTRASLHNLQRFESMKLGRGALLEITRRGGVIPMVQKAITHGDLHAPYLAPTACPACDGAVERVKRRDGEFLFCASVETCTVARLRELEHFAKVTDMMGFGPKFLQLAFDAELLFNLEDFFTLTQAQLQSLDRVGEKTANNLLTEVQKARTLALGVFLQSLGIPHLGRQNAQRIASAFGSLQTVRSADETAIMELPGFQETMAQAIIRGLLQRAQRIDHLLEHIEVQDAPARPITPEPVADSPLSGRSVLFTGTLTRMPRAKAQALLPQVGATAASGVSAKLDLLVIGEGKGGSSKEKKARALMDKGAPLQILDEESFWALIPPELFAQEQ